MADDMTKIPHPSIKDSRVLMYLNQENKVEYTNTDEEDVLMNLWRQKFYEAQKAYESSRANTAKVKLWRDAYQGIFYQLNENGEPTKKLMKPIRKIAYELVEDKVNSKIPAPQMEPRHHSDIITVNATEELLKHEMNKMTSESTVDASEHGVLIDGTTWFKVSWNPFDNTHERSGNPIVSVCPIDTVYPQPGISIERYKDMEYIFELGTITVSQCFDLYNRYISSPTVDDIIPIVTVYFLNEDRYVGRFIWCEDKGVVLANDLEWGIRKRRECTTCHKPNTYDTVCPNCGGKTFKYVSVKNELLDEPLKMIKNPYRENSSNDINDDVTQVDESGTIPQGTVIPYYLIRQLPFVPYIRVSRPMSFYGMSEVELVLENQDLANKFLNKAEKKSKKSKTYVTKLTQTEFEDTDEEIAVLNVDSPQECSSIQVKQIVSDISEEMTQAQVLYDIAKSVTGVTDTDQGKADPTARSGKAKQLQMAASAQRNTSPTALRNLAYSGVYELIFKYLLAYCDEDRTFISYLPDGSKKEQTWSKYMFLAVDNNGEYYYRDDFAWGVDTASEITDDRAAMWQMIDNEFLNGTMGSAIDPNRALLMYWQMKAQFGYPIAKFAVEFLTDAQKRLPTQVEEVLASNPDAVEMALSYIQDKSGGSSGVPAQQGGARPNAGRQSLGTSHAANVEKTNNKNRAAQGMQTNSIATSTGGMQGGTQ